MPLMTPDRTFYPSPTMAMQSPPEKLAYLALINPLKDGRPDAIGVVDVDPDSNGYGRLVGQTDMPHAGDELHHFGWNACSSCLCPYAPHPAHGAAISVVPGINSSRIHILDTKPDPRQPQIVKVIEPETLAQRTGYAAPHTVHCGPDGILLSALGAPDGNGPGGTFMLDPDTFDVRGRWEIDRGPQQLAYDIWWHLGLDTMVTSTWGTPNMVKDGVNPELLLGGKYGNKLHVWDLRRRRHLQELTLGDEQQMTLELRPGARPDARLWVRRRRHVTEGSVLVDLAMVSGPEQESANGSSGAWAIKKVIEIPAEPADPDDLPPLLQGFKVAAPLVTDIDLSVDDRYLYVSCWGTGEFIQYDVSDPFKPKKVSSIRLGGIVRRSPHPSSPEQPAEWRAADGRSQSRRAARLLHEQPLHAVGRASSTRMAFEGWMAKIDVQPGGRDVVGPEFLPQHWRHASAPGSPGRRRRFVRFVLLRVNRVVRIVMDWWAMVFLGAFHGINPGMGWLFAVALGMQHGSARGVWRALPPIALGHAGAVGVVLLGRRAGARRGTDRRAERPGRADVDDAGALSALASPTSTIRRHAGWLSRSDGVVVSDGVGTRRRIHDPPVCDAGTRDGGGCRP